MTGPSTAEFVDLRLVGFLSGDAAGEAAADDVAPGAPLCGCELVEAFPCFGADSVTFGATGYTAQSWRLLLLPRLWRHEYANNFADEIEAEGRSVVGRLSQETEKDRWRLIGAEDAYKHALRLVRGDQEGPK